MTKKPIKEEWEKECARNDKLAIIFMIIIGISSIILGHILYHFIQIK